MNMNINNNNNNSEFKITITLILCISQFLASCMSHQEKEVLECQEVLVSYVTTAGKSGQCGVDLCNTTVADLKEKISIAGEFTGFFELLYNENILRDGNMLLKEIDNPSSLQNFTIVMTSNIQYLKSKLGESNILGEEVWQALGVTVSDITDVSQEFVATALKLKDQSYDPVVVLDIGMSIEALEAKCAAQKLTVLGRSAEKLRAESCYKAPGEGMRWLLFPGSDHGVLPGSRNKDYNQQVQHMHTYYPGYEVGGARELVMVAMLKYLQDGKVLFGDSPSTYSRCKEKYQTGEWKGHNVLLGNRSSSASGGLVVHAHYWQRGAPYGLFGSFVGCSLVPGTKKP
jgi:hypothetical protein